MTSVLEFEFHYLIKSEISTLELTAFWSDWLFIFFSNFYWIDWEAETASNYVISVFLILFKIEYWEEKY